MLVVNGGYGREVYGFTSNDFTLNSPLAQPRHQIVRPLLVHQQQRVVLNLSRRRIEILAARNLLTVDRNQRRLKLFAGLIRKCRQQIPIRRRMKRHPLPLPIDDQPHRHALHAPAESFGRTFRHNSGETS